MNVVHAQIVRGVDMTGTIQTGLDKAIETGLLSMAIGRLTGGAASRVSPSGTARFFGAATERSPELDYVVRVCGIRAMALGLGYLSTTGDARRRWQQLALLCDISDTVAGIGDLVRATSRAAPHLGRPCAPVSSPPSASHGSPTIAGLHTPQLCHSSSASPVSHRFISTPGYLIDAGICPQK
jgi:hypothetical protein